MNFPLRPGAAKLAFNYDEPYDCHAAFQARHEYPLRRMAVMIPLTMSFSSRSQAFEILATGNSRYQVQAANHLKAGEGPGFEISGAGVLPPLGEQSGLYAMPSLCTLTPVSRRPVSGSVLSLAVLCRHVAIRDHGKPVGCFYPVPSPTALAFDYL